MPASRSSRWYSPTIFHLAPGRALCLAEGEGRNAVFLAEAGFTVTSVDLSQVGVAKTRRDLGDDADRHRQQGRAERAAKRGPERELWNKGH